MTFPFDSSPMEIEANFLFSFQGGKKGFRQGRKAKAAASCLRMISISKMMMMMTMMLTANSKETYYE